ncbi:MAG: tRNA uridine-5-carboxymethylaminomethyl(34) synthesis GTPase MnmE [Alphaproteobacteria bacterium]|nr:tRNA uridine-5-carboxymethylaminomethyl(34) synthesis GTPase MnmE [Alphaproteobacteria bacterium]
MTASDPRDTIFAVASGAGRAAIAVLRVSGPRAVELVTALAGNLPRPRLATLRTLTNQTTGEILDRGLVLWMPGPHSATGEDVAEFHVHGGSTVIAGLCQELARHRSVRPAEAGELTRRAFANGRIDLVEAEGLADLLAAETPMQRRLALGLMLGAASARYEEWRSRLLRALAMVEAAIDFSEESDVARYALVGLDSDVKALAAEMSAALAGYALAREIRSGITVVLAGPPNTGKSSLLNRLAEREAAIVSPRPGTTRDVIEVRMELGGMAVTVMDTAGLRQAAGDEIENEGMARTRARAGAANLLIWVAAQDVAESLAIEKGLSPDLVLLNKSDLAQERVKESENRVLPVSAKTGAGIAELVARLAEMLRERYHRAESAVIVRERHRAAVTESIRMLNDFDLNGRPLEMKAESLRLAAHALGRVTGHIDVESLLDAIFAEFCIGK